MSLDHLEIYPRVFAENTMTVDTSVPEPVLGGNNPLTYRPHEHDVARSIGKPWETLLEPSTSGPIVVKKRGKLLNIAAGNVSHWQIH